MADFQLLQRFQTWAALIFVAANAGVSSGVPPAHDFRGVPYFQFFDAEDFDSSAAASFITTSSDGTLFYCDRNWLFLYDGISWRKIYQNSKTNEKITVLHWDKDGHIYAGGFGMIGELVQDENNQIDFRHLVDPDDVKVTEHFERIHSTDTTLYLIGRRSVAIYEKANGNLDSFVSDTWITGFFELDGQFHILTDANEILRYENHTFQTLPGLTALMSGQDVTVTDTAVASNGDIIMGSERRGIFRFDGESFVPAYANYKHDPDHLLRDIELTSDHRLIVATLGGGIFVLDQEGNVLERFGANIDYRFKSTRSVAIDRSGAVWAMSNSTIAKILLDSSLSAIDERLRPSFFYATQHLHEGELYVRSFYILYRALYDEYDRIKGFENALPEAEFEVWSIAEAEDGLYINTSEHGIFRLSNGDLTHLIDSAAFDRLKQSSQSPNLLVGVNSNEIALYEKQDGKLKLVDSRPNKGRFVNRMEEDKRGDFWLEYGMGAAGRIRIRDQRIELTYFDAKNGLPPQDWMTIWMHLGDAYYTSSKGVMRLDLETGSFIRNDFLAGILPEENLHISRAFTDQRGNIWISANDKNMILWMQPDGSYRVDDTSLSEMGEPFLEFLTAFDNGEALLMTALEFFHFRPTENALAQTGHDPVTRIIGIAGSSGAQSYFNYLGDGSLPAKLSFTYDENSLVFSVANSFSFSTKSPEFQYFLQGFSPGEPGLDSAWTQSSNANFTNLNPGDYRFKARARLGDGKITEWAEYAFVIKPAFYQTYFAYFAYLVLLMLFVLLAIELYSRRLKTQNLRLEKMVGQRTTEIEAKNLELENQAGILESQNRALAQQSDEIQDKAAELSQALAQLRETQDQLLTTARTAGRAEVATNVLHNVGNVLNSVNVGITNLDQLLRRTRLSGLKKLSDLLKSHRADLSAFLLEDPKGVKVPEYLEQLSITLGDELKAFAAEVKQIDENVDHIKKIIATQQTHAKNVGVLQFVTLSELLDSALAITLGDTANTAFDIVRRYEPDLVVHTDKHKVLEVLINVIKNASESVLESGVAERRIELISERLPDPDNIQIRIRDNGVGIAEAHRDKLFLHGFTTKNAGHGFGLHSCANTIKSLGGSLQVDSPGPDQGATATIILPRR